MTRPDQPAPGENTSESGQDTGPVEGAGESGDVDPREPMEDASDMTPSGDGDQGNAGDTEAPDPLEPPD
ncbi:MAG: hypothetical protein H0U22_08105 [Geodermatophilaceae bacterium]|jgi:hypothetical protein|nr:hypothetical protein [Geodermatophilaceae bacterium]